MIDHAHLYDVFDGCSEDVDARVFEWLGEVVSLSWRLVLNDMFPERKCNVDVSSSDQDDGPVVTFFQMGYGQKGVPSARYESGIALYNNQEQRVASV